MRAFIKYHILDRGDLLRKKHQLRYYKNNKPILVHTMAKVGSLSVYNSLILAQPKAAVFHTHNLDLAREKKDIDFCFENNIYPASRSSLPLIKDEIISVKRPYKIISLYRDPIKRNISAFFDAFKLYVGMEPNLYRGTMSNLENIFHKHIPHSYPLNWFDDFLKPETGIDVYKHEFNSNIGHSTIKHNNIEIIILKSSLSNELKERLIGNFCDLSDFKLNNINITAESKHAKLYSEFKDHIKFSNNYLNQQYNSKYAKQFFTESEREIAKEKWRKI